MLTERERRILELFQVGLSDYKIARQLGVDPPSVTKSRQNALRKLQQMQEDLSWAHKLGLSIEHESS
jgi:DNA-binding NarL/FixJ family response regulator